MKPSVLVLSLAVAVTASCGGAGPGAPVRDGAARREASVSGDAVADTVPVVDSAVERARADGTLTPDRPFMLDLGPPVDATAADSVRSGDGTGATPCPATPPASGGRCAPAGLQCSYGDDPRVSCRVLATCASGSWSVTAPPCSVPPVCPATEPTAPMTACTDTGETCGYGTSTCDCYACIIPCTMSPTWHCMTQPAGCPGAAPNLGTPCSAPASVTCNYGACTGGWAVQCSGGIWKRTTVVCPG